MSDLALPIRGQPDFTFGRGLSSDERLARLVSRGSTPAFASLYQRHHQALYRYCRSVVCDEQDAQDALQSTMANAFLALRSGERDLAVRPWLFAIAHNESVSILRKRRANDPLAQEHEPSGASVEQTVEGRERLRMLVRDLGALPERQRAALLMRELSGLGIGEIAQALSVSPGAAKQTIFQARSSLHEFAEGRAMECERVRRAISDGDRRALRARKLDSHLRACAGCRDFRVLIDTRTADLRALAPPLPATAASAMLAGVLAHGTGPGYASGAAAGAAGGLANHAAASLVAKGLVGAAVIAAATAGTLHLARGPAKHGHTPTHATARAQRALSASPARSISASDTPAARAATHGGARLAHGHTAGAQRAGAPTVVGSSTAAGALTPAQTQPAVGPGEQSREHLHGSTGGRTHPASGPGSRGSHKGQGAPLQPTRHRHSSSPATPTSPAGPARPRNPSHNEKAREQQHEGNPHQGSGAAHAPAAQQAPTGEQPAHVEAGSEAGSSTQPGKPEKQHGNSGK